MGNASESFLAGGGPASVKFPNIGDAVEGTIKTEPTVEQQRDIETGELLTWQDGNPRQQLVVTLQTDLRDPDDEDDDGVRRLFVKGNMRKALQEAVIKANRKQLDIGGKLAVAYIGDGEKKNKAFNAPKLYKAVYTPPNGAEAAAAFLAASGGAGGSGGIGETAPVVSTATGQPVVHQQAVPDVSPEALEALKQLGLLK